MRRIAPEARTKARRLRKDSTDAESILWNLLRGRQLLGYKFRRQVSTGKYIADFACLERKLIIELDGGQHQEQADYDAERTGGWNHEDSRSLDSGTMRFWRMTMRCRRLSFWHCKTSLSPDFTFTLALSLEGEGIRFEGEGIKRQ